MDHGIRRSFWRGSLSCLLVLGVACKSEPPPPPPPPPEVGVAQPITRPVTLFAEFTGNTVSSESVQVRARVGGVLEQVAFEVGSSVEKGDLLFVIEPRSFKASLNAAQAAVRAAQADLERTESDLSRVTRAAKTNAVSESDVDLARARRDMAEASVLTAEAALDQADLQYSYTRVLSPIQGIVDRNLFDVGNVVGGPGENILTTVNRVSPLFVYFNVPERAILQILQATDFSRTDEAAAGRGSRSAPRLEVQVRTLVDEGFPHRGVIDFLSNTVDSSTGMIQVRGSLPNAQGFLLPGLFVRVRVPVETVDDAILIDGRAIGADLGGRYLYLIGPDNIVEQRYVEFGQTEDDGMVLVTGGLERSDTYIVDGLLRARPGLPVRPVEAGVAG